VNADELADAARVNANSPTPHAAMVLLEVLEAATPADFDATLAKALAACEPPAEGVPKATLLVLITSTTGDNEPGKKWCEDCDAADPVIERVLTASEDRYVLLNALCKRSEYKKALNPDAANYPYRLRPEMNSPTPFAGIPTLVRWEPPYNKIDFPEAETRCYATKAEEAKVVATIEMLLEAD
jgi:hypothetical protein